MKRIGILGGISLASTLAYYKTITDFYYDRFHDYYYPEILINSLNFQYFTDLEDQNRMEEYKAYILEGISRLEKAGADFVLMAANSPHSVLEEIRPQIALPVVSIVDAVAEKAQEMGLKTVLLTGIRYTMQRTFYQEGFRKYGIHVLVPNAQEQETINQIIFGELVIHKKTKAAQDAFKEILSRYKKDGVILGCTELPLLLEQGDVDFPLLNSLELHCRAALDAALKD